MADLKITQLAELTSPLISDIIPIVDDPSGSPVTKKITLSNLLAQKTVVTVSTSDGADYVCDGTADDVQIQAALTAVGNAGGGVVHVKIGTYSLSQFLWIPDYVILEGEGWGTVFQLAAGAYTTLKQAVIFPAGLVNTSTGALKDPANYTTTYGAILRDFKIDANRANITGLVANYLYGIQFQWVNNARIENVWVINAHSSGIGVWPSNPNPDVDAETIVSKCRTEDNNASVAGQAIDAGIIVSNGTGQPAKVIVSDCISLGNRNGYCIEDSSGGVSLNNCIGASNTSHGVYFQTTRNATINGGFYYLNGSDGISTGVTGDRWHSLNGVQCYYNGRYGAYTGHDWSINGGQFVDNDDAGIVMDSTVNNTVTGAIIAGNGASGATYPYGVYIVHGSLSDQNTITGCFFGNDYNSYRVADCQTYGIFESGACVGLYTGNTFATYGSTQVGFNRGASSTSIIRNNRGWVTENSGTGTIASGATTAVVTHGLSVTPTLDDINITFGEQGTSDYGRWWVSTITATQFTLNVSADPGASGLDFAWKAIVL